MNPLDFVKGAVSTKDFVPVLTHFRFENGRVQGSNGRICMDAPYSINHDVVVPAVPFLRAMNCCSEPTLSVQKDHLIVKEKSFRARLPLSQDTYPTIDPEGSGYANDCLVDSLKRVLPFIGTDASRPWACGALVTKDYVYATNNVTMVRVPNKWKGPDINIPGFTIQELVRIGEILEPSIQASEHSITFHFGDRWMRSQLFDAKWPSVDKFFSEWKEPPPLPNGLIDSIEKLIPFVPDKAFPLIRFSEKGISTMDGDLCAEIEGIDMPVAKFHVAPLLLTLSVATNADFSMYPGPCRFSGDDIQGVLVGVR